MELMEMFTCFSCFAAGSSVGPSFEWRLGHSPQRFYARKGVLAGYTLQHPARWYGFFFVSLSLLLLLFCYLASSVDFPKPWQFLLPSRSGHSWQRLKDCYHGVRGRELALDSDVLAFLTFSATYSWGFGKVTSFVRTVLIMSSLPYLV